jgi:hypothetical protein
MKKLFVFGIFLLAAMHVVIAQDLGWAKRLGNSEYDYVEDIFLDASGNVYITGSYEGTVDFDLGELEYSLTSNGGRDMFILKLDEEGNFIWAKSIGGPWEDRSLSIVVDSFGNVYATGHFERTVDFDPGEGEFNITVFGGNDAFILKLDEDGNFLWAKRFGGEESDNGQDVVIDSSGNIYITGFFWSTADFDPSEDVYNMTSSGGFDVFVVKLTMDGDLLWAKRMGGNFSDHGMAIAVDPSGNVYTTGDFSSTADFNPGLESFQLTSLGYEDVFISKLNAEGEFLWVKTIGGTRHDIARSIAISEQGIYVAGTFENTVDFNFSGVEYTLTSMGVEDFFICKVSETGQLIWANGIGGRGRDLCSYVAVDNQDNVFITGRFEETVDFDPSSSVHYLDAAGTSDMFISKFSGSGNLIWAHRFGGNSYDGGDAIAVNDQEHIYVTGHFLGTMDFDLGTENYSLPSAGQADVFIMKYVSETVNVSDVRRSDPLTRLYPNPAQTDLFIDGVTKIKSVQLYNMMGVLVQTETQNAFSVDRLPPGVYLMQVLTQDGLSIHKLVKE